MQYTSARNLSVLMVGRAVRSHGLISEGWQGPERCAAGSHPARTSSNLNATGGAFGALQSLAANQFRSLWTTCGDIVH
jgi:hypothetical protein